MYSEYSEKKETIGTKVLCKEVLLTRNVLNYYVHRVHTDTAQECNHRLGADCC